MIRKWLQALIHLIFCIFFFQSNDCLSQDEKSVTRAVVIGISKYRNLNQGLQLNFADRDAKSMFDFIAQGGFGPVKMDDIRLLTNETANFEQVRNAVLQSLYHKDAKPGDHVIIYFAGHGDMQSEFNAPFLLTHDAPENKDYHLYGAFEIDELQKHVSRAAGKGQKITLIVDACRSGKVFSENGSKMTLQSLVREWENVVKIISCGPDENSLEGNQWGGGHGVFTYYLLKALEGMADIDADRVVRVFELNEFLAKKVREETSFKQIPKCVGSDKKIVVQVNGSLSQNSAGGKGDTKSRSLQDMVFWPERPIADEKRTMPFFPGLFKGNDTIVKAAWKALTTRYLTRDFLAASDSFVIDSCPAIRFPLRAGFSLEGFAGRDSCIFFTQDGKWRLFNLNEGMKVDSGSSWEHKVKNVCLNWPWLVYREYKEDDFVLLNLKTGKKKSISPESSSFKINKIWMSPSGKYLLASNLQNGLMVYDCEKRSERYVLKKAFLQSPDYIQFNSEESAFTTFSFVKSGQVLWFTSIKPWSGGKLLHTFKKDLKGGAPLLMTREQQNKNLTYYQPGTGPLFIHSDFADSASFSEFTGKSDYLFEKEKLRIMLSPGRQASASIPVNAALSDVRIRDKEKLDFADAEGFQRKRIFSRPSQSAEELISLLPASDPEKSKLEFRLAEELEIFAGKPMAEYTTSGKLARPDSLRFSIAMLKKSVSLYGDSLLAETAIKKLLFFDGLLHAGKLSKVGRDSALACFSELNKRYPKAAFPLNAIGEVLQKSNKAAEARPFLEKAQKFTPQWILPSQNIQKVELMEGNIEKARASFELLLARKDFTPSVAKSLAEIYFRYGDLNRAAGILEKADLRFPEDAEILLQKARIYSRKMNYEKAWRVLFRILEKYPAATKPSIMLAGLPGRLADRLGILKRTFQQNPNDQELSAAILLFLKKHDLSRQEQTLWNSALSALRPENEGLFWAAFFRADGSISQQIPEISSESMSFEDWYSIASNLYETGLYKQSIAVLDKMEQQWKNSGTLLLLKAKNLAETKETEACLAVLDEIDKNRKAVQNSLSGDSLNKKLLAVLEGRIQVLSKPVEGGIDPLQTGPVIACLDSIIQMRNSMGLRTDDAHLAGIMSLRDRNVRKWLASRRTAQGYGLYTPSSQTCGEEILLRARCYFLKGYLAVAKKLCQQLSEYDPGDARIPDLESFYQPNSRSLMSEYRSLAFSGDAEIQLHEFGPFRVLSNAVTGGHFLNLPGSCEKLFLTGKKNTCLLQLRKSSGNVILFNPESGDSLFGFDLQLITHVWMEQLPERTEVFFAIAKSGNGWGIIRSDGAWMLKNQNQALALLSINGKKLISFQDSTGKTGLCDGSGRILLKPEFDVISLGDENNVELYQDENAFCFSIKKNQLSKGNCIRQNAGGPGFTASKPTDTYLTGKQYPFGLRAARHYDYYGFANETERFIIQPKFEAAGDFVDVDGVVMANVRIQNKEGFIDRKGKFIIQPEYDETSHIFSSYPMECVYKNLLIARKGSFEGVIDGSGKEVVPFKYKEVLYLTILGRKTLMVARTEEGSSIYDLSGNQLAPGYFDNIRHVGGKGIFEIRDENENLLFDLNQNEFFKLPEAGR